MKKLIAVLVALMLTLSVAALAEGTTFEMGIDDEFPPFSYIGDDGEFTGFDIDMATAVCDILGWDLQPKKVNWDNKLLELKADEVDCIWSGLTIDNIPANEYTLSVPYLDNMQVVVTMADSGITTLADLAGKIVGVQNGTSAQDMLTDGSQAELGATFADIAAAESYNVCFADLQGGAVDAVAIDSLTANTLINATGKPEAFVTLEEVLGPEKYGICFRKDDEEMCLQVQRAFNTLVEDGTYQSIAAKYEVPESALCLLTAGEDAA